MTERIRIIIDTEEEIRLAVRLAATKANLGVSEFINQVLRRALAEEIKITRNYIPKKRSDN